MTDSRLTFTLTKAERNEHIAHKQAIARSIAAAIDADMPLVDWEQVFLRFVLSKTSATDDHAGALRKWAVGYQPGKRRGPAYTFSAVEAAMEYALQRELGLTDYQALQLLVAFYGVSKAGMIKAIRPHMPSACAHLGIDPATVNARKPRGRPRSAK